MADEITVVETKTTIAPQSLPQNGDPLGQTKVPLSPDLRSFLFEIAAGDMRRRLSQAPLDWSDALRELRRHGLLGLAHHRFRNQQDEEYPPAAFRESVKVDFAIAALQMQLKYRAALRIFRKLSNSDIGFLLVKGLAVGHTVYPMPSLRVFNDIDIVVREKDWSRVHHTLLSSGFVPQEALPTPPPKLFPQNVVQELQYWNPDEQVLVEVHYDDLLYAGLASRDVDGFWRRARSLDLAGVSVRVLSAEDQLIHLCAHLHYDGVKRLNWFSDIAFIVRDHAGELDWQTVVDIVRKEEVQVPVYYALSYVGRVLGVWPPKDVLVALRPDRFRRWWHERFAPQDRILSFEVVPHPYFSFYFLPLFRRLIPDLLVMGRRREKLRALFQLIFPPQDWLCYYYGLMATDNVSVHYLLHVLKMTCHYAIEIGTAIQFLYQEKRGQRDWAWWCFNRR